MILSVNLFFLRKIYISNISKNSQKFVVYTHIFNIIVYKSSYIQMFCLMIFQSINKSFKLEFNNTILFFSPFIYFLLKKSEKLLFYIYKIE